MYLVFRAAMPLSRDDELDMLANLTKPTLPKKASQTVFALQDFTELVLLAASHSRLHAPGVKLCGPATPLAQMALCLVAASLLARPALDRPNIVMLFVDDLGYGDVGFNGHPTTSSPTIDKLAWGGKILTTWYSGCPVCSCSRAALMTGRQWPRYGVSPVFNPVTNTGLPLNETTLAEALKGRGVKVSRLARGLPTGWSLEFANKAVLGDAIMGRQSLE